MKTKEIITRSLHTALCLGNIGCLFFAMMLPFAGRGSDFYLLFKYLSIACCLPMFLMRSFYLQYILFGILLVSAIWIYIDKIRNKNLNRAWLGVDIFLWAIAICELVFLEDYYWNIYWF